VDFASNAYEAIDSGMDIDDFDYVIYGEVERGFYRFLYQMNDFETDESFCGNGRETESAAAHENGCDSCSSRDLDNKMMQLEDICLIPCSMLISDSPYFGLEASGTALLQPTRSTDPPQSYPSNSRKASSASRRFMKDTKPLKPALLLREAVISAPGPKVTSDRGHIILT